LHRISREAILAGITRERIPVRQLFRTILGFAMLSRACFAAEGKGIPVWERLHPDTLFFTEHIVYQYKDSLGLENLLANPNLKGNCRVDSVAKVVHFESNAMTVRQDSAGLPIRLVTTTTDMNGSVIGLNLELFGYDVFRRKISEIQTMGDTSNGWDTTRWVWTHEGCADELHANWKVIWSVDALGRCSTAVEFQYSELFNASWRDAGRHTSLLWNGNAIAQESVTDEKGVSSIIQDSIESDSLLVGYREYLRNDLDNRLDSTGTGRFSYVNGRILEGESRFHYRNMNGTEVWTSWIYSTAHPANLGIAGSSSRPASVTSRCEGRLLRFANNGSETLDIQVSTVRGERIGSLRIAAGQSDILPLVNRSAMLVWSARGRATYANGTVPPTR